MRWVSVFTVGFFLVLATSCQKDNPSNQEARLYQDGLAKPVVALVPVIDSTHSKLPWNLSEELTSSIHYRLMQKNRLYLVDFERIQSVTKKNKSNSNPFDTNLLWINKAFFENEFVVFLELIQHEEAPLLIKESISSPETPAELSMSMRIRVVDIRSPEPKIILQEIIENHHYLPQSLSRNTSELIPWNKENYTVSALGIAHAKLSKEVAAHLEDYILLALHDNNSMSSTER